MWFKNLTVYRLPVGWSVAAAELEDRLSQRVLQACAPFEKRSIGWAHAGPSQRFVHTVMGQHLITLACDEKILPAAVVRQHVQDRAAGVAEEQGFPCGRRQMRELKETVTQELLARALTKRRITRAWIDTARGLLVIDAASLPRAEEVVSALREALGTFAVTLLETEKSPMLAMASWLVEGDAPLRFSIDQDLELQAADKSAVKYQHHQLDGKEIRQHLQAGKCATQLGLSWNDRVAFRLTDKLQIKRVEFIDIQEDKGSDERDPVEQFDIDFSLMTGELGALIQDLITALGGEAAREKTWATDAGKSEAEEEALFASGVDIVTANGKASISFLQRQLEIGYNRAARIIERMEVAGIVSPMQPDGTRQVLAAQAAA